ncbi:unnamed protein product [Arabidopsis halleri]
MVFLTCFLTSWRLCLTGVRTLKYTKWRKRFAIDARWIWNIRLNVLLVLSSMLVHSEKSRQSAFKDFTFENIVKVIKMNLKMPCDKEGCGKQNYVQRLINKLPTVFTIALEWTKNESAGEIYDTASVLATEIDVSVIYQCEGDNGYTKYRLVSMVCSHGDRYNCVAYENNRWVRYLRSEIEVIGDWDSVVSICLTQSIRPQILFFESVSSF